jgi:hypothetical protein
MTYVPWPTMMGIENVGSAAVFLARGFFETAQDLDCRFSGIERPYMVTDVLSRCLKRPDNETYNVDELWSWTLPQRLQALIAVVTASGQTTIQTLEQCPACGETTELELDLTSFVNTSLDSILLIEPEPGTRLVVEVPTGRHQLEWLIAGDILADEDGGLSMATSLTKTINGEPLAPDWRLPQHWFEKVQKALEEHDPLTSLSLPVDCPGCSEAMAVELDLEELLLMKLGHSQKAVLEEVFYLARVYHWNEVEIFNMPAWRRRFYVHRCQQEMQ